MHCTRPVEGNSRPSSSSSHATRRAIMSGHAATLTVWQFLTLSITANQAPHSLQAHLHSRHHVFVALKVCKAPASKCNHVRSRSRLPYVRFISLPQYYHPSHPSHPSHFEPTASFSHQTWTCQAPLPITTTECRNLSRSQLKHLWINEPILQGRQTILGPWESNILHINTGLRILNRNHGHPYRNLNHNNITRSHNRCLDMHCKPHLSRSLVRAL